LSGTGVTDRGIPYPGHLEQLKYIAVVQTQLSSAGIARLKRLHPQAEVRAEPWQRRQTVSVKAESESPSASNDLDSLWD
jgi:hypothetical protein